MENNKFVLSDIKLPFAWTSFGMATYGDKMHLICGDDQSTYGTFHYAYDFKTKVWETKASVPAAGRINGACVYSKGKIYLVGGISRGGGLLNDIMEYDIVSDIWTKKADIPPRATVSLCAVDGLIYICGGTSRFEGWNFVESSDTLHVYNPKTNTLVQKASMPYRLTGAYNMCSDQGNIFFFGNVQGTNKNGCLKYQIEKDEWTYIKDIPQNSQCVAQVENKAYLIGTTTYQYSLQDNEISEVCVDEFHPVGQLTYTCCSNNGSIYTSGDFPNRSANVYTMTPSHPMKLHILLDEEEKINLTATLLPQDAVPDDLVWSSTDETITTVDQNGVVTAVKAGTSEITVCSPNSGFEASVLVLVVEKGISGLRLSILLKQDERCRIVMADDGVIRNAVWSSSDENIAVVDNVGRVTALAQGATLITACDEDGEVEGQIYVVVKP